MAAAVNTTGGVPNDLVPNDLAPNNLGLRSKKAVAAILSFALFGLPLFIAALVARIVRKTKAKPGVQELRLLWAGAPLLSLKTASAALASAGFQSRTIANTLYVTASEQDFDAVITLKKRYPFGLNTLFYTGLAVSHFIREMFCSDVLHSFFDGAMLGRTSLAFLEYPLWKMSGGKLILMPYGSDAFVYSDLPDTEWARMLKKTYPRSANEDKKVALRIKAATRHADRIVGCLVHDYCLPRVDDHPLLWYPFDQSIKPDYRPIGDVVEIVHVANHPHIKGSTYLKQAVDELKAEGFRINLTMLVGVDHAQALEAMRKAHIVVDQLLFGYALAALEGMAFGKPTITCLEPDPAYQTYRARGQLENTGIISAGTTNIKEKIKYLLINKNEIGKIGENSRIFAETIHGNQSTVDLYIIIYHRLY